jgi:hypothetical protein
VNKIFFESGDGKTFGALDLSGPEMVFSGDAEESAKVMMEFVVKQFGERLKQERNATREACAQVCEGNYDTAQAARAIRARGEA